MLSIHLTLRFKDSVYNYYAIRDSRYFANIATDSFLGTSANCIGHEGNPWKWGTDNWYLKRDFDINVDFPSIVAWESTLLAASHKMCFRHKGEKIHSSESNIQNNIHNDEVVDNDLTKLRTDFPNTPHPVFIAECIKSIMKALNSAISQSSRLIKGSVNYINNGRSFRYIMHQLSSTQMEFHDITMLLLYALPSKLMELEDQISDINDVIGHIREQSSVMKLSINYIKIFNNEFDNSQQSHVSSQELINDSESPKSA